MKFEVTDKQGRVIFWTEHEECVPDEEIQATLLETGYRIFVNGEEVKK